MKRRRGREKEILLSAVKAISGSVASAGICLMNIYKVNVGSSSVTNQNRGCSKVTIPKILCQVSAQSCCLVKSLKALWVYFLENLGPSIANSSDRLFFPRVDL